MIRFRTFGGLELRREDGSEVRSVLAQPRRTALLVSLVLAGGGVSVRRDVLVGRLWPESSQERARHSLNQALYQLRRSLGREVIVSQGEEALSLDPLRFWCDALDFDVALKEGRLEEALELFRGDFLPGFFLSGCREFESWLEEERDRKRDAAARAAWSLAERAEQEGLTASASSWGHRARALSGESEMALQRLLRLLTRVGDRAGAVAAYESFSRRLSVDPGMGPSPETVALIREIRGPRPEPVPASPSRASAALPPRPALPLVGRDEEMRRLKEILDQPLCRLLTVTGPGGVGKTRLVLEFAWHEGDRFPDGVWFVPLAHVTSVEMVPSAILRSLGLPDPGGDSLGAVQQFLAGRRGLLVLDNLEHLPGVAPVLAELLDASPQTSILTTSREVLRLRSEWVLPLQGLEVSDDEALHPEAGPSARLFIDSARRAGASVQNNRTEWEQAARICRLLEGIPLAIELAAAWMRSVPLDDIEREIEGSLRFLAVEGTDIPERHRSLWAAFEHSWSLLSPAHRRLLSRLSVFRGGFDREAAARVAEATLPDLAALVERSLIQPTGTGRYEILEVTREFAAEKLLTMPEESTGTLERHAEYYLEFLRDLRGELAGPSADDALDHCAMEMENLRSAWRTAVEGRRTEALGLAADALFILYDRRGWHREADDAFRDGVDAATQDPECAAISQGSRRAGPLMTLLARRGAVLLRRGKAEEGEGVLHRALELARAGKNFVEAAFVLDRLGVAAWDRGATEEAERLQREALTLRQEAGDLRAVATSLNNLGSLAFATGDHREAKELCEQCLELQRRLEDRSGEVISLQNLGHVALLLGDEEEAERRLQESLRAARALRHGVLAVRSLLSLGNLASTRSNPSAARRYFPPALARAMQIGNESLALEAVLGFALTLTQDGDLGLALELVTMGMAQPALDGRSRLSAERLLRHLDEVVPPEEQEDAIRRGKALSLRGAAHRLAGMLGTTPGVERIPE